MKRVALTLLTAFGFATTGAFVAPAAAQLPEPVLIIVDRSSGEPDIVGWSPGPKQGTFQEYKIPEDKALKGARLVQAEIDTQDLRASLERVLAYEGFQNVSIAGEEKLKNARALDARGLGGAFVGKGAIDGETYHFASIGLYGSLDNTPRYTTHYLFIAPEDIYKRLGGFVPVLSAWFELDATQIEDLILRAGQSEPEVQARYLAGGTDYYIARVARAMNLFISNIQSTTNQLLNQQCTGVSGTGPDAYGITGLGNPDC